MTLNQFIEHNKVKQGDAIVVKKDNIGLLDHYLIYLGQLFGEHKFIANYFSGTRILSNSELINFSQKFSPSRIRRFIGTDTQRKAAVTRALSRRDQQSYHLILNNCEHYANYVQTGTAFSNQTNVFGTGMAITGLAMVASSKSEATKKVGTAVAVFGLLALMFENSKK